MAEFVVSNNYFEFFDKVYQQNWGTAIGTKFAPFIPPAHACITETEFLIMAPVH